MKIGVLGWDYGEEDADAPLMAEIGRERGHETVLFTLEDVGYAPARRGFEVTLAGHPGRSFDAIISRAKLYGDDWADRVERLAVVSALPGVRVFDPVDVWLAGYSKFQTTQRLADAGLPVPPTRACDNTDDLRAAVADWGEVVVKPARECAGTGVVRVTDVDADAPAVGKLIARFGRMICQPFYPTRYGEYRITVAGDELPLNMVKYPAVGEWMCRTPLGASFERIDIPDDLRELALRATRLMGMTLAGLDILPTADGYVILEINPVPGNLDILGRKSQRQAIEAVYRWVETRSTS